MATGLVPPRLELRNQSLALIEHRLSPPLAARATYPGVMHAILCSRAEQASASSWFNNP